MIAFENSEWLAVVDADQQQSAAVDGLAESLAERFDVGNFLRAAPVDLTLPNALYRAQQVVIAAGNAAPVRSRENLQFRKIRRFERDLPPLRIGRQFAPHGAATTIKERFPGPVFKFVCQIRVADQRRKSVAVAIIFGLEILIAEKFRDHLRFQYTANPLHGLLRGPTSMC